MFVAQIALTFEQSDQLAPIETVLATNREEQTHRTATIHRKRTNLGILLLVQLILEGHSQQGRHRHLGRVVAHQFDGHIGVGHIAIALDHLGHFVLDALAFHRHDVLRRGQLLALDVDLDVAFQVAKLTKLRRRKERNRRTRIARTTRTTDTMHVALRILRQRVIDYVCEVYDVDTARRNVRSHQDVGLARLELAQNLLALRLRHIAVQTFGRIASLLQTVRDLIDRNLRATKDNAIELRLHIDNASQRIELITLAHLEIDLIGQIRCNLLSLNSQQLRLTHIRLRQTHNSFGHRCREQQHTTLLVHCRHNRLDILDETHIEHLVSLVQHHIIDRREVERAATDVVQHSTGCTHNDIDTARQTTQLLADRRTAIDCRHRHTFFVVERDQLLGHLQRQLARGHQYNRLNVTRFGRQQLQQRQSECRRFARTRLSLRDQVLTLAEQCGDRQSLDRRRTLETLGLDCTQHLLVETQLGKSQVCFSSFILFHFH